MSYTPVPTEPSMPALLHSSGFCSWFEFLIVHGFPNLISKLYYFFYYL